MKNIYRNENSLIFKNNYLNFETDELLSPIETQNYTIIQVADSFYNGQFTIPKHKQKCDLEITYPLSSSLYCSNNNKTVKLNKHDIHLCFKDDEHMLYANKGCRFQTLALNIKTDLILDILGDIKSAPDNQKQNHIPQVAPLISEIISELVSASTPFSQIYIDSLITNMLIKISRPQPETNNIDILSTEESLPAILNYIDTHFLEISSLTDIATKFGYSYNHICKTFSKRYKISLQNYLTGKKMDHALSMLKKGKKISQVSEIVGYSSPYNFSRAFKKHFGCAPSIYKQK